MITIFTDGASKGNPGPGGWGAIISNTKKVEEIGGAKTHTTNNEMELVGVVEALKKTPANSSVQIFTDSSYVVNGASKWILNWQKRDWKTLGKKDVLYRELWEELIDLISTREIVWNRVSGHVGLPGNERVDSIASSFASGKEADLFSGNFHEYKIDLKNLSHSKTKKESKNRSKGKAYSYVSAVKGVVMVHKTWSECEKRVKGVSSARFKKSLDLEDEKRIIRTFSE